MIDCMVDRSKDWSMDSMIDWLFDWSFDWLMKWLVVCFVKWSIDWLIYWLIGWLIQWSIEGWNDWFSRLPRRPTCIVQCTNVEETFNYPTWPESETQPFLCRFDVRDRGGRDAELENLISIMKVFFCEAQNSVDILFHCVDSRERAPLVLGLVMKKFCGCSIEACVQIQ